MLSALSGKMSAQQLSQKAGIPLASVLSFSQSLKEKGLVSLSVHEEAKLGLTPEAQRYLLEGFPEQKICAAAEKSAPLSSLSAEEKSIGLAWAAKNGWVRVENGILRLAKKPEGKYTLSEALSQLAAGDKAEPELVQALEKRKLVFTNLEKTIYLQIVSGAAETHASQESVNLLTREMLLTGKWRENTLRQYDVSAPAEVPFPAKRHMVSRLKRRIARIFTDMGFDEMEGPEVQSSFWNFDALFQPQDHPARELADTFYLKGACPLPKDSKLVGRVKGVHEKYWGGKWLGEKAEKSVLRTHTTALSAKYLHEKCAGKTPKKYFAMGKVYRNEATDYKHLAEFFQVEGIVVWEGATFCDLLGCLKEFYRKLGFAKIRFQPSYFPYTEPSLEISVYFEKKKQWLELGGAGIFRPEVSIPLCGRYPVLAWGLSLERPLMLLNEMDDIRDFYKSNVGWLRKQKLQ